MTMATKYTTTKIEKVRNSASGRSAKVTATGSSASTAKVYKTRGEAANSGTLPPTKVVRISSTMELMTGQPGCRNNAPMQAHTSPMATMPSQK